MMFSKKGILLITLFIMVTVLSALVTQSVYAAPIVKFPVTVTQPDGEKLNLFSSGDEYYNWLPDAQGYTVIQRADDGIEAVGSWDVMDATSAMIAITGKVVPVSGVTLSYFDGTKKQVTTDAEGIYIIFVPSGWSGTVTPSRDGYSFMPASYNYTNVTIDKINQNYAAKNITVPITISPSGTIKDTRPTFVWNASEGATSYWLNVYNLTTSEYAINHMRIPTPVCTGTPSVCRYLSPENLSYGSYRFSVEAGSEHGYSGYGPWESWRAFVISPYEPLTIPVTISPTGNISDTRPTFVWRAVINATHYELTVYNLTTSEYAINRMRIPTPGCTGTPRICSFLSPENLSLGSYRFSVEAHSGHVKSGLGPWASWRAFVVLPPEPLAIPVTISPTGMIYENIPTFVWNASEGATHYWLNVYNMTTSKYAVQGMVISEYVCGGTPGVCRFRHPFHPIVLSSGSYRFSIAAVNSNENSGFGPFADWRAFVISPLAIPVTISPTGTITETIPTFVWNASEGATSYWLHVYNLTASKYAIQGMVIPASVCTGTPSVCRFRSPIVLSRGSYRFSAAAVNGTSNSGFGLWASWRAFNLP